MAGGSGTRFWPLSRAQRPKQFLPLTGSDESLIQATATRMAEIVPADAVMVVTAASQSHLVKEQLPKTAVLAEPVARNTAPCIGLAAIRVLADAGDVPMICVPADHMIRDEEELAKILRAGVEAAAKDDVLVTVGLKPTQPETGYGYIQRGAPAAPGLFKVARFVEKPDRPTAEKYLASGEYFWNSGMFVWRPSVILKEMRTQLPKLAAGLDEIAELWKSGRPAAEVEPRIAEIYSAFEPISIDYGIMERAGNVLMIPGEKFRWSDVGSWSAWAELEAEHVGADGNFVRGDAVTVDSKGCFIRGGDRKGKYIAAVGVEDLIIVETDDAVLICHRDRAQDVKKVVDELHKRGRKELL